MVKIYAELFAISEKMVTFAAQYSGVDWIWQQAGVVRKHAERWLVAPKSQWSSNLSGNNNYALAA